MGEEQELLIETWRRIIVGEGKSWVLFKHGTCVVLPVSVDDPVSQATALMKEWGPVQVGTPSADFDVVKLEDDPGWVVTCHHPDILTYIGPGEFAGGGVPNDILVGLAGRLKRHQDAEELEVVHSKA